MHNKIEFKHLWSEMVFFFVFACTCIVRFNNSMVIHKLFMFVLNCKNYFNFEVLN